MDKSLTIEQIKRIIFNELSPRLEPRSYLTTCRYPKCNYGDREDCRECLMKAFEEVAK